MSLSAVEYLRHILDETGYLTDQTQQLTKDQFLRDATLKRALRLPAKALSPGMAGDGWYA